jgi:hypothetical protein
VDLSKTNIVSYPDRGAWGDSKYRGNTSGWLIRDLIEFFRPRSVLDPMEGSGTTRDVCRELGVEYDGFDLKGGFDALTSQLLRRGGGKEKTLGERYFGSPLPGKQK